MGPTLIVSLDFELITWVRSGCNGADADRVAGF